MGATMGSGTYKFLRAGARFIGWQTMRTTVLDRDRAGRPGGFILACTHLSHLDPILVSAVVERQVYWMARREFFERRWAAATLRLGGAFPVDRFGACLRAIRAGVRLAREGCCVGICPEGGVARGEGSVLRGASLKQGTCTIAIEAGVPVVPVVVLGSEGLTTLAPWLPFRRGRLAFAFGRAVAPPARSRSRRADRAEMTERLRLEFLRTHSDLVGRVKPGSWAVP